MQGNCASEPSAISLSLPAPDLKGRKTGQCVLVTDIRLMEIAHNLWLDNLYIRQKLTDATDESTYPGELTCQGKSCNLWLTSVTLQGAQKLTPSFSYLAVYGGQMFASGAKDAQLRYISGDVHV
jgi:hypothetical protein